MYIQFRSVLKNLKVQKSMHVQSKYIYGNFLQIQKKTKKATTKNKQQNNNNKKHKKTKKQKKNKQIIKERKKIKS